MEMNIVGMKKLYHGNFELKPISKKIHFNKIDEFLTIAGCVRIYENLWFDGDQTVDIINNECSSIYSSCYWKKKKDYNIFSLDKCIINNRCDFIFRYYNDVTNIFNTLVIDYCDKFGINDLPTVEKLDVFFVKPNSTVSCKTNGLLQGLLFLNSESAQTVLEYTNFGISLKPDMGCGILTPSGFTHALEIKTDSSPAYFFRIVLK
jgi:hypothetical protein